MKALKRNRRGAWWLTSLGAAAVLTAGLVLIAQSGSPSQNSGSQPPVLRNPPPQSTAPTGSLQGADNDATGESDDPAAVEMARRQALARNAERQQQLVADTQKLYELASELRDDVAKTNKNVLSIDVIKRADEIDKLAKSIRDKMKGN